MPVKLDECPIPDELARYHVINLFEENGPQGLLRSIENAFKLPLQAEPTSQQELEHQLSKAIAPEQALALQNLSAAAKALLREIRNDDRSDTKGLTFMYISETQGFYVPYLWDITFTASCDLP
jgi:hypothetical protein